MKEEDDEDLQPVRLKVLTFSHVSSRNCRVETHCLTYLQENKQTSVMKEEDDEDMQLKVCFIVLHPINDNSCGQSFIISWDAAIKKKLR